MEARISGTTKLFGLIGSPVSHSASPAMQNYGFQACGVDGAYLAFDIKEEEVPEFVKSMRLLNIQGCNVTMPNKTAFKISIIFFSLSHDKCFEKVMIKQIFINSDG